MCRIGSVESKLTRTASLAGPSGVDRNSSSDALHQHSAHAENCCNLCAGSVKTSPAYDWETRRQALGKQLCILLRPSLLTHPLSRQTLEETVACYCIVVRHVTEEYGRVASILTSCCTKLQRFQDTCDSGAESSIQEQKSIPFFIIISSLMVSSCDLDTVKVDRQGESKRARFAPAY